MTASSKVHRHPQSHYTIGIAGHIDHGKTTLTKALTGKETDRLKEEKERGISIEPGFASFTLANGQEISLIDVPGHERFIRQMVAGVAGVDLVLLVVAADEGMMPQTEEHLHILHLLGIQHGIIVLTKIDQADQELIQLVKEQIIEETEHTFLAGAPILEVNSLTGDGIEALKKEIESFVPRLPARPTSGFARLPIDRVFTKKGMGTIVTGTLYQGKVKVGDELSLLPYDRKVKIRQIQVHGAVQDEAYAGQRVALNLTGVDKEQMIRGHVLATPNSMKSTQRLDVEITMIENLMFSLKQRSEIRLHLGTSDVLGRVIFFDRNQLQPGETCFAQLELEEPVSTLFEDRFVLRRPTPMTTIGGGMVIDPYAEKHRFGQATVEHIASKKEKDVAARATHLLNRSHLLTLDQLLHQLGLSLEEWSIEVSKSDQHGLKLMTGPSESLTLVTTTQLWKTTWQAIDNELQSYHQRYPLREGMDRKRVQQQYYPQLSTAQWNFLLETAEAEGLVKVNQEVLAQPGFDPVLSPEENELWQEVQATLDQMLLEAPPWSDLMPDQMDEEHQIDLQQWLLRKGEIIMLDNGRFMSRSAFEKAIHKLKEHTGSSFTIQEVRDLFQTSRKFLIPFLEAIDRQGYTVREENIRTWRT